MKKDDLVAEELRRGLKYVGDAISADAAPSTDAYGGHVRSLTEAVMGVTGGLMSIAHALDRIADALREEEEEEEA